MQTTKEFIRAFTMKAYKNLIGIEYDGTIQSEMLKCYEKGFVTVEDLQEIDRLIDAKNNATEGEKAV